MDEGLLPAEIRAKASVTPGGEHAWRFEDVPAVLEAARAVGLASLGGQPQFQFEGGTCEPYWINVGTDERGADEPWEAFVDRSTALVRQHVEERCTPDALREAAGGFRFIREKVDAEGVDPMDHVWLVLCFATEAWMNRPREPEPEPKAAGPSWRKRALKLALAVRRSLRANRRWAWYAVPPLYVPVGVLLSSAFDGRPDHVWNLWFIAGLVLSTFVGLRVVFERLGMPTKLRVVLAIWNLWPALLGGFVAVGWSMV
jgi:hypothetical protein